MKWVVFIRGVFCAWVGWFEGLCFWDFVINSGQICVHTAIISHEQLASPRLRGQEEWGFWCLPLRFTGSKNFSDKNLQFLYCKLILGSIKTDHIFKNVFYEVIKSPDFEKDPGANCEINYWLKTFLYLRLGPCQSNCVVLPKKRSEQENHVPSEFPQLSNVESEEKPGISSWFLNSFTL